MSTTLFSHKRAETAPLWVIGITLAEAAHASPASPLPFKRRGVRRAKALFCQCDSKQAWRYTAAKNWLCIRRLSVGALYMTRLREPPTRHLSRYIVLA